RAPLQIYYNGGQRVTRILARPDADAGLARELMEKLSVLQLRTVVASSEAAGPSPGPAILPDSVPFPPAADQPGMARFDELFRPRILSAELAIVHIDILNAYQARYFFSAGGAGRAALLYFFNGRGVCTTCTVDARRTTDAHLAGRVLALSRGGDQAP
ncbi:MAG: hypothetical protein GX805_03470, partial [Gammaproteobacteria bacterium]|nr:hypothetical protein [Gammaproteobacteria bacterium]